jgi:hypothetical protein
MNKTKQQQQEEYFSIIAYLRGATIPELTPNVDTLEAMVELDSGGGHTFKGSASQLFAEIFHEI